MSKQKKGKGIAIMSIGDGDKARNKCSVKDCDGNHDEVHLWNTGTTPKLKARFPERKVRPVGEGKEATYVGTVSDMEALIRVHMAMNNETATVAVTGLVDQVKDHDPMLADSIRYAGRYMNEEQESSHE